MPSNPLSPRALPPRRTETNGRMIASRSFHFHLQMSARMDLVGSVPVAQKLVQTFALDNVAPRTSAASYMFGHVHSILQTTAQKCFVDFPLWRPDRADVCTKLRADRSDPVQCSARIRAHRGCRFADICTKCSARPRVKKVECIGYMLRTAQR
jgi:hypothetical protein